MARVYTCLMGQTVDLEILYSVDASFMVRLVSQFRLALRDMRIEALRAGLQPQFKALESVLTAAQREACPLDEFLEDLLQNFRAVHKGGGVSASYRLFLSS